jgi:hypothetical protein
MAEHIYLHGSEDVQRAGHTIAAAASDIQRAANQMDESMTRFLLHFDQMVSRLENLSLAAQPSLHTTEETK